MWLVFRCFWSDIELWITDKNYSKKTAQNRECRKRDCPLSWEGGIKLVSGGRVLKAHVGSVPAQDNSSFTELALFKPK